MGGGGGHFVCIMLSEMQLIRAAVLLLSGLFLIGRRVSSHTPWCCRWASVRSCSGWSITATQSFLHPCAAWGPTRWDVYQLMMRGFIVPRFSAYFLIVTQKKWKYLTKIHFGHTSCCFTQQALRASLTFESFISFAWEILKLTFDLLVIKFAIFLMGD